MDIRAEKLALSILQEVLFGKEAVFLCPDKNDCNKAFDVLVSTIKEFDQEEADSSNNVSGVFIKGMSLPENCLVCPCFDDEFGFCGVSKQDDTPNRDWSIKPQYCPMVEIVGREVIDTNCIFSETIGEMIPKGFTRKNRHYTWCESDAVYYRDDVDDLAIEYSDVAWNEVEKDRIKHEPIKGVIE